MLAPAPPRVGLALLQVDLPADVVRLQRGGVGIEVEDLVHHHVEQRGVVADHHQAAAERLQVVAQPGHRVGVQVVGRLVQQQGLRVREQDPGQLHPAPLPAGQGGQRLAQHPVRQSQAGGDRRGLGLRGVAAEQGEPFFQLAVAADRGVAAGGHPVGHLLLGGPHGRAQLVQAAAGQHPVQGQPLQVAGPRVLGQVADAGAAPHGARRGERLTREHPGQRGLARAVPADQADLVARRDLEARVRQQQLRARAQLQAGRGDHLAPLQTRIGGKKRHGRGPYPGYLAPGYPGPAPAAAGAGHARARQRPGSPPPPPAYRERAWTYARTSATLHQLPLAAVSVTRT